MPYRHSMQIMADVLSQASQYGLDGANKSNLIQKQDIYKKNTDKGEFFFYKKPSRKIKSEDVLKANISNILENG